jgi:hypothetical protein
MDRKRPLGAIEKFTEHLQAAAYDLRYELRGEQPPVCMREMMLVDTLTAIATGEVRLRDVRGYAMDAVQRWKGAQRPAGMDKED